MEKLSELTKEQYYSRRRFVRENILLNSRVALLKRSVLPSKKVIMGGIVIRKKVAIACFSDKPNVTSYVAVEKVKNESDKYKVKENSYWIIFDIFDFSGIFKAVFHRTNETSCLKLFKINKGDVIYIEGEVIPINAEYGYFLSCSAIYSEDEMFSHRDKDKEEFLSLTNERKKIMDAEYREDVGFILGCRRYSMDTIRLFLSKNDKITLHDYFWLIAEIGDFYRRKPSKNLVQLAYKYFCRWYACQKGWSKEPRSVFGEWYPEMAQEIN